MAESPTPRQPLGPLLVVAVCWCGVVACLFALIAFFRDPDSHFHIRLSAIMAQEGLRLAAFPFATESIWSQHFFDKDWLFHLALIPSLLLGDVRGPQLAVVVFNLLIVVAIWRACRALGHAQPAWLVLLVPLCGYDVLWSRLTECRPHLLSLVLLFAGLAATVTRRRWTLALICALYALGYTGHWQMLGVVLIYDVLYAFLEEDGQRRTAWLRTPPMLVPAALGMLLGECAHPQFPHNLYGLVVQNLLVLKDYWQPPTGVEQMLATTRPMEIWPYRPGVLLFTHAPLLLGMVVVAADAVIRRQRPTRNLWWLTALTAIYLVMTLKSQRFSEYLVPVGVVTVGLYWHHARLGERLQPRVLRWGLAVLLAVFALGGLRQLAGEHVRLRLVQRNQPYLQQPGQWLARHLPPGEIVFATGWSDNPYLFYQAPRLRYLVFLDPYFMYRRSPERFALWQQLRLGNVSNPAAVITETFGAHIVYTSNSPAFAPFIVQLMATPGVVAVDYGGPPDQLILLLPGAPLIDTAP